MNQGRALDMLTVTEKNTIVSDIGATVDDTDLSQAATYRDYVSNAFTPSTGAYTPTYTDTTLRVLRGRVSLQEIAASGGLYQRGDVRFLVDRVDLTVTPTREDRLVLGGDTYEIVDWSTDPISALWLIVARLVKTA